MFYLNDIAPRRYGAGFFGGYRPPFPQTCKGANPYLYKRPLAPGARIKLTKTRADCRVVIAMTVQHYYPASCRETRPQVCTGGSPSGEGRSVKKICLWHIFSVGRSGYAARKRAPWGTTYLYKKPLAPWARIKLTMTRTDSRVVIAMTVPHPEMNLPL